MSVYEALLKFIQAALPPGGEGVDADVLEASAAAVSYYRSRREMAPGDIAMASLIRLARDPGSGVAGSPTTLREFLRCNQHLSTAQQQDLDPAAILASSFARWVPPFLAQAEGVPHGTASNLQQALQAGLKDWYWGSRHLVPQGPERDAMDELTGHADRPAAAPAVATPPPLAAAARPVVRDISAFTKTWKKQTCKAWATALKYMPPALPADTWFFGWADRGYGFGLKQTCCGASCSRCIGKSAPLLYRLVVADFPKPTLTDKGWSQCETTQLGCIYACSPKCAAEAADPAGMHSSSPSIGTFSEDQVWPDSRLISAASQSAAAAAAAAGAAATAEAAPPAGPEPAGAGPSHPVRKRAARFFRPVFKSEAISEQGAWASVVQALPQQVQEQLRAKKPKAPKKAPKKRRAQQLQGQDAPPAVEQAHAAAKRARSRATEASGSEDSGSDDSEGSEGMETEEEDGEVGGLQQGGADGLASSLQQGEWAQLAAGQQRGVVKLEVDLSRE